MIFSYALISGSLGLCGSELLTLMRLFILCYVTKCSTGQAILAVRSDQIEFILTLSLPMLPFCDQRQSANFTYMRLGHVVCFSDVYYPILRYIVANKGDNLNRRPVFGKQTRQWQKIVKKNVISIIFKASQINFRENCG